MSNDRWRGDDRRRDGERPRDQGPAQQRSRSWGQDWASDYQWEREHEFGPDHHRLGPGGHYASGYDRNQGWRGAEPRVSQSRSPEPRGPESQGQESRAGTPRGPEGAGPGFEPPYRHEEFGGGGVGRGYEGYGQAYGPAESGDYYSSGYGQAPRREVRERPRGGWARNAGWDDRPDEVRRDQQRRDYEQRMRRYEGRAEAEPRGGPRSRPGPEDRSWWNRTRDEVGSWFGDDQAERRRRSDAEREGRYRDERSGDTGWGDPFPGDPRGGGRERRARSDREYWSDADRERWDRDRSW